jgi:uncharacterized protein YcbK (DUF882 family)
LEQFGSEVNVRFQQQQDTLETLEKEQGESVVSFHENLQRTTERMNHSDKMMQTALLENKGMVSKALKEMRSERREKVQEDEVVNQNQEAEKEDTKQPKNQTFENINDIYENVFHNEEEEESQRHIDELERQLKFSLGDRRESIVDQVATYRPKTTVTRLVTESQEHLKIVWEKRTLKKLFVMVFKRSVKTLRTKKTIH